MTATSQGLKGSSLGRMMLGDRKQRHLRGGGGGARTKAQGAGGGSSDATRGVNAAAGTRPSTHARETAAAMRRARAAPAVRAAVQVRPCVNPGHAGHMSVSSPHLSEHALLVRPCSPLATSGQQWVP
jgi:hypothetical protein